MMIDAIKKTLVQFRDRNTEQPEERYICCWSGRCIQRKRVVCREREMYAEKGRCIYRERELTFNFNPNNVIDHFSPDGGVVFGKEQAHIWQDGQARQLRLARQASQSWKRISTLLCVAYKNSGRKTETWPRTQTDRLYSITSFEVR